MTQAARVVIDLRPATRADLRKVMPVMTAAFDPAYGEAWSEAQMAGLLIGPAARLVLAHSEGDAAGFALTRDILDETELMLIATVPEHRGRGIGAALLRDAIDHARGRGSRTMFLEVRRGNPAEHLYLAQGFAKVGERPHYYRGVDGRAHDARTFRLDLN